MENGKKVGLVGHIKKKVGKGGRDILGTAFVSPPVMPVVKGVGVCASNCQQG